MSKSRSIRTKRQRRRAKAKLNGGRRSVRRHTRKGGRTGRIMAKRTPAAAVVASMHIPNKAPPDWITGDV